MPDSRPVPPHAFEAGSSIVNLAAGVAGRFGVATPLPPVNEPTLADALAGACSVVTVLLDGLGERQLAAHAPRGVLAQHRLRTLDSVFPSSTAPAVTSLATAAPPAVHGNPAWLVWSERAGAIIRTLPMDVRGDRHRGIRAADTWSWQPWATRARAPSFAILPREIADSEYSRHAYAGSTRVAYARLDEIAPIVVGALRACPDGASVFVYLPQFDSTSHEAGWQSEAAAAVVGDFDRWFGALIERLRDVDALVLATADHGFVDVARHDQLRLEDFPAIAACLERPLSGEPRVPFCQVRPGRRERFAAIVTAELGDAFAVHESDELLHAGWFGAALPDAGASPLAGRLGTHVLVPRRCVTLVDAVDGERAPRFIGMHGGISDDEMRVPLVAAWRGQAVR
ncbi:MAG TPA: alkaline phosphatase family protein [Zeimonas sp.]|nr:alkaline phosphatase family protein [Zeimonas sp.]